jgi:hypothetical protein
VADDATAARSNRHSAVISDVRRTLDDANKIEPAALDTTQRAQHEPSLGSRLATSTTSTALSSTSAACALCHASSTTAELLTFAIGSRCSNADVKSSSSKLARLISTTL